MKQHDRTLICFSHLRWDFVFQRPQHLMTRFARRQRVIFFQEPVVDPDADCGRLEATICPVSGVVTLTPTLPEGDVNRSDALRGLLDAYMIAEGIARPVLWYYTPLMRSFSRHIVASAVVYDCMDELANFRFAPPELVQAEAELMQDADLVFTGGHSLYEAKRHRHANIHSFPSSVDVDHFRGARTAATDPADQRDIPKPRLGYYGVIDERIDLDLLAAVADARPEWHLVMVGPLAKLAPSDLPVRPNLHYLGRKDYTELPAYLGGWNVALMPFALNDATRFISPTKTPEYLAGGRPVVSTPIADVVSMYGQLDAVSIANDPAQFIAACDLALALAPDGPHRAAADDVLSRQSWEHTFEAMANLVDCACHSVQLTMAAPTPPTVRARAQGYDYLIIGAGFAGSVLAERLARGAGQKVLLIDRRPHIGGNAYDHRDPAGIMVHRYGPHIFHTNSQRIFNYLSQFTFWRPYEHRVLAAVDGKLLPIPINRTTLNMMYGLDLQSEIAAAQFLSARAEPVEEILTAEDVVLSTVGRDLYDTFFRGYTRKQWGRDPSELDKAVTARVPARFDTDDRYFTDRYQFMPRDGYTCMFENMLDHPNITVQVGVDAADIGREADGAKVICSGPIDEYFDFRYGPLPYRSLAFDHTTLEQEWLQPVAVVNYPDETTPYTRITEYKHLTGQSHRRTSITHEYPSDQGDPYYPIPCPENQSLYRRYEALAQRTPGVTFVGRLGTYRYYNMDQVVGQALATYDRLLAGTRSATPRPILAPFAGQLATLERAG